MILRSMFSMASLNMVRAASSLIVSFLVAKTVPPEAFGLVSFVVPLMTFITILTDLGLGSAIVRHPDLSRDEAGAAVTLLLVAGAAGAVLLSAVAVPLEHATHLAGLAPVMLGFAAVTLLTIWAAPARALLERAYDYRRIVRVEFAALAVALGAVSVALWLHWGIMSIVVYQATMQLIRAGGLLTLARGTFTPNFRWRSLSGIYAIGGWLLVTNILTYCARNLDNILIGAYLGARSLGIYGLAYQFMTLPLVLLTWPVSGVLLSTLARLRHDETAQRSVIGAVVMATAIVTFPMMTALTFAGDVPLHAIYSDRWAGLTQAVALLAPAGAAQSIASYAGSVLVEKGAVRLNFVLSVMIGSAFVATFFSTVWFGLPTLMFTYTMVSSVICVVHVFFMCRVSGLRPAELARYLLPGAGAAAIGLGAVTLAGRLHPATWGEWAGTVTIFVLAGGATLLASGRFIIRSLKALQGAGQSAPAMSG